MFMIIGGWAVASCALLGVLVGLGLHWNFMDWSPKWDGGAAFYGFSIAAIMGCIWFLAKATRDRGSRAGSLLICLILAGVAGVLVLPAEPLTAGLLSRTMPSPLWYRGANFLVLCLPGLFWLWKTWHHPNNDHEPNKALQ